VASAGGVSSKSYPGSWDGTFLTGFRGGLRRFDQLVEVGLPGTVSRLDDGFGILRTSDGREIYFHRNSVLNDAFSRLQVGTRVTFAEAPGENGPQASTVRLFGKHGLRT
jgi:cold shock CspA family protein